MSTRSLEEVVVKEGLVCKKEESPCYFIRDKLPDSVPRCVTLTAEDGQKINQCEVYVSPFEALLNPVLDLYDLKELRLSLPTTPPRAELVVFRLDSNVILSPDDYACSEGRAGSCSQQVVIPDDLERFGVLVVTLDEEEDVKSLTVTFQVYKAQVEQLALDVFRVTLDSSNPAGNYALKLHGEASVKCEATTPDQPLCQAFFCRVNETDDVTIRKSDDEKSVTYSVMRGGQRGSG
nr:uncharacterized protein LOC113826621 [Penaeus vannamei]